MAMSEARKRANEKWNKENMTTLSCKVRKEYAENVRKSALEHGLTVNSIFKAALDDFLNGKNVHDKQPEQLHQEQQKQKGYPFTVYMPDYLLDRCKRRYERTKKDPKAFVLQALEEYGRGVSEKNSILISFAGKEYDGFDLEQIEAAANANGMSVHSWVIEAIKDKL